MSVICTQRFIFIAPKMVTQTVIVASRVTNFSFTDGVSMEVGLQNIIHDPQVTLESLEETLQEILGRENVYEVAKMDHFKIHLMWILSQARFSLPGRGTKVLSLGKPSHMKAMNAFYFPR